MSLRDILKRLAQGEISLDETARQINVLTYKSVREMAKIDHRRADRIGVPEAILAEGKRATDLVEIALAYLEEARNVIITRVSQDHLQALKEADFPQDTRLRWEERARMVVISKSDETSLTDGKVGILTAGTADIPVAEEARVTAEVMGCEVISEYDLGVAGIHRLFPSLEKVMDADALVVAAGREGTLPAIVAGLVDVPVVGLPVSTGYGAGGNGQAALLSMLQSCSVITVVNIDAGFVAGAFAAKIANQIEMK
ncbi:MAG: nickel pincer cofactor biosynthesis protein LarB [Methanotrichaceae archaeon]